MKRLLLLLAAFLVVTPAALGPAMASSAATDPRTASETYYRADVAAGTLTARVELHVQAPSTTTDLTSVRVFTMPGATSVVAKSGADTLQTQVVAPGIQGLSLGAVVVALARPLKPGAKTDLEVTYTVAPQSTDQMTLAPGALEALFISQGAGSFVLIDVPSSADNFFEPGCLKLAEQPADVLKDGFERWVCGEASLIAVFGDHPEIVGKCAYLDDACRQHAPNPLPSANYITPPFAGYVQSITDPSLRGVLEEDVPMMRGPVKLTFKYLGRDQAWAQVQFTAAKQALPKLEAVFGFAYPRDTLVMRESHAIGEVGLAGLAYPSAGEVLVTKSTSDDRDVTIHELAHQWAGTTNLAAKWEWEGLAEYGMRSVAPSLGITPDDWGWQSYKLTDPLATWDVSSLVQNSNYWYGKAGAFWFAYENAIGGPANVTKVLANLASPPDALDAQRFMDLGEDVSGANLDALFGQWVFPESAKPILADRRAARDLVAPLNARTTGMGIIGTQAEIAAALSKWDFASVAGLVAQARHVLDAYVQVYIDQEAAGLSATDRFGLAWSKENLASLGGIVADQRAAMDAIGRSAKALASQAPDSPGQQQLAKARTTYATGNFLAAKQLASGATTVESNLAAAAKMIELAKAKQAAFHPSFVSRVGLLFASPDAELAHAQAAVANGDPVAGLHLARASYDAWDGASSAGLKRLAMCAALLSATAAGLWWLRRTIEGRKKGPPSGPGHVLLAGERRSSWRDWENS